MGVPAAGCGGSDGGRAGGQGLSQLRHRLCLLITALARRSGQKYPLTWSEAVLRIRIHMLLGLPDPDPLVRDMDPRIRTRIRTKIAWIRNNGLKGEESCRGFSSVSDTDPGSNVILFIPGFQCCFLSLDSNVVIFLPLDVVVFLSLDSSVVVFYVPGFNVSFTPGFQCCCFFNPWIRDPRWKKIRICVPVFRNKHTCPRA